MTTHYERRGEVAVLQIDNPPVNGLGHVTRKALLDGLERALDDAAVKVVVVTGTGSVFSGGADIREFNTPAALAEPNLLQLIDAVEAIGIDPADAAPDYWHHAHNRLSVNEIPRPYTRSRHQAWLHRRRVMS